MNLPLWTPPTSYIEQSNLKKYESWLQNRENLVFKDYEALWQWSVGNVEKFWETLFHFFEIQTYTDYQSVLRLPSGEIIGARWFEGATLNYAEHIFRHKNTERPAIIFQSETQPLTEISWETLETNVASIKAYLQEKGVEKGDRVVGYLPNTPETIAIFLAVNALGAVWSCCSPDFGLESLVDRFQQIEPKVLFTCDSYHYGGKFFDKSIIVNELSEQLPTLKATVVIGGAQWDDILNADIQKSLEFTPVEFNHPIWILYSSGTT